MTISIAQANSALANITNFDQLRDLIAQLDVTGIGTKTLLYSGSNGWANEIALELERIDSNVRIVDSTDAAKFLNYDQNPALELLLARLGGDPSIYGTASNKFLYDARDANGKLGAWAMVSKNFVALADGEVRVIAPQADLARVFGEVEVPELIANTKVTSVEGMPRSAIEALIESGNLGLLKDNFKLRSFEHLAASGLYKEADAAALANFLDLADQNIAEVGYTPQQLGEINDALKSVDPQYKAYLNSVAENTKNLASSLRSFGSKGFKFLGAASILFTFAIASSEASAEAEAGNHDAARRRMNLWAVETAASEIGGAAAAALAVMGLALIGVTSAPVLAVAAIGAAVFGGYFAGQGATSFYESLSRMSPELQENIIDRLNILFYGDYDNATPELKVTLNNGNLSFQDVSFINAHRDVIVANAKESIAWRYALRELNPFVVENANYDGHNEDGTLDLYDPVTDKGFMSDEWINTRAAFLAFYKYYLLSGAENGLLTNYLSPKPILGDIHFVDHLSVKPVELWVDGVDFFVVPEKQVFFGGNSNEVFNGDDGDDLLFGAGGNDTLSGKKGFDYIEGNAGNDLLYGGDDADHLLGGAGDDQLVGEGGNDILEGGTGNDIYSFTGTFGQDIIKDSDGVGSIVISGVTLSSLIQSAPGSNVYYDNLDNPTKRAVVLDEGDTKSLIISTVTQSGKNIVPSGNSVTIKNWQAGNLGLNLQSATASAATDVRTVNGNGSDNAITLENVKDNNGSYTSGVTALYADGGAGRDIIMGSLSANDTLLGGDDSDIISGGFIDNLTDSGYSGRLLPSAATPGKDSIDGGKGNDYIFASLGGGVAHGGDDNDILSARSGAYFLLNNQETLTDDPAQYNNHGFIKRDDIWGDLLAQRINFGITVSEDNTYTYNTSITKDLTNAFVEYTGSVTGIHYIAKLGSNNASYNSGGFGINYSGSYTYAYDYNKENNAYRVVSNANQLSPVNVVVPQFSLASGHTYAEYANQAGANLFGDKGNDTLYGGMFADVLSGGDDNDIFFGGSGHDIIDGGTGNDEVYGEDGNDLINGGDGDDTLSGSDSNDILAAGVGDNDTIYGGKGIDYLFGGRGKDYLEGGTGGDYLLGEDDNDYLYGGDDDEKDALIGGAGDDTMVLHRKDYADGQSGNNIYIYDTHEVTTAPLPVIEASMALSELEENTNNNGSSWANVLNSNTAATATQAIDPTYIFNTEGQNTLALAGVGGLEEMDIELIGNQLQLGAGSQKLMIADAATGAPIQFVFGRSVEQLAATTYTYTSITDDHFLNGTAPLEQSQLNTADIILATHANTVVLTGLIANQYLAGGLINDTLTANSQGTRFIGGRGDDKLLGSTADDTYLIRKGDGNDTIIEQGGNNHIKLDKNINTADVKASRTGADLLLTLSPEQSILVKNMFDANTGALLTASAIADITFYNGDVWDINQIKQRALLGSDANDVLGGFETNDLIIGGKGNDQLQGAAGNDTYRYALGDGQDIITDTQGTDSIQLSGGITAAQVIATRDGNNNLVLGFSDGGKITVANAFDVNGNFTANAIEAIVFSDSNTWSQAQIKTEVLKDQSQQYTGTTGDDLIKGSTGKDIINGGKGNDQLQGDIGNDVYQYALGDGKDVILDLNGSDRIEFLGNILSGDVVARSNGNDLVLKLSDGGGVTVKDMFVVKTAHAVDPQITALLTQLQTQWISQAATLIKNNYGLDIKQDISLGFTTGEVGGEAAHVAVNIDANQKKTLSLVVDLVDFANLPNGAGPLYYDRVIAHELVHAAMASNFDINNMPGWFVEGVAELIHGADERVKNDLDILSAGENFTALFKTSSGSPGSSAGYSVAYIAAKFLDKEIRTYGGNGIKDVFTLLTAGSTLDQALTTLSNTLGGMGGKWNNLTGFETYFKSVGFASVSNLLHLNNNDTGSIAGSDYGNLALDPYAVVPDYSSGLPTGFQLIVPSQYIAAGDENNTVESIKFSNTAWDLSRIKAEAVKGTGGNDSIIGFADADILVGGIGSDTLVGGAGNDIYQYALGDGDDIVIDSSGVDTLELAANIAVNSLTVTRSVNNLVLTILGGGSITVIDVFNTSGAFVEGAIEQIKFSNNTIWNQQKMLDEINKVVNLTMTGTDAGEYLTGGAGQDSLYGLGGNDTLVGGVGNDVIVGGKGDDTLSDVIGDEKYRYDLGDGNDRISDNLGNDELVFGAGILSTDITVRRVDSDLVIWLKTGGSITYKNMFSSEGGVSQNALENISFVDNTRWNLNTILSQSLKGSVANDNLRGFATDDYITGMDGGDTITSDAGNDTLVGGVGNDSLVGGAGNDTYIFNPGDGKDLVSDTAGVDTIQLGAGISASETHIFRDQQDVVIRVNQNDEVRVRNAFSVGAIDFSTSAIESIAFASGEIWDSSRILTETRRISGTANRDTLVGYAGNDTLIGGKQSDVLFGGLGDDTYFVNLNEGYDLIIDDGGVDTLRFGSGVAPSDVMVAQTSNSLFFFTRRGQFVRVDLAHGGQQPDVNYAIEKVVFDSDGTSWDAAAIQQGIAATKQLPNIILGDDSVSSLTVPSQGDYFVNQLNVGYSVNVGDGVNTLTGLDTQFFYQNYGSSGGSKTYLITPGTKLIKYFRAGVDKLVFADGTQFEDLKILVRKNSFASNMEDAVTLVLTNRDASVQIDLWGVLWQYGSINVSGDENTKSFEFLDEPSRSLKEILARAYEGTDYSDQIYGFSNNDLINGGANTDTITGGYGSDTLLGGSGNDTIYAGGTADNYARGADADTVAGGQDDDLIYTGGGDSILYNLGDGSDIIRNDNLNYNLSHLVFGEGILPSDVSVRLDGEVTLDIRQGGKIALGGLWGSSLDAIHIVQRIDFKNGVSWTPFDMVKMLGLNSDAITPDVATSTTFSPLGDNIAGSAEVGAKVVVKNSDGTQILGYGFADDTNGSFSISIGTPLKNGELVNIYVVDASGKNSNALQLNAPDLVAPQPPVGAFDTTGKIVKGAAEPGSLISIRNTSNTVLGNGATDQNGNFSITLSSALINKQVVSVTAQDAAGNISSPSAFIAPDKTAPAIPSAVFDAAYKVLSGSAEAGSTVRITNKTASQVFTTIANASGQYSYTFASPLVNKETVEVVAIDASLNVSAAKTLTTPDKTPPATPSGSFQSDGKTIKGVAEPGSTVTFKNSSGTALPTTATVTANATTGAYTAVLTTALLDYQLVNVYAKDAALNTSTTPLSIHAPDTTKPPVTNLLLDNTTYKTITGRSEPGSTITVKNKGTNEVLPGAIVSAGGTFTVNLNVPLKNKELIEITAKDISGNVSLPAMLQAPDKTPPAIQNAAFDATGKYINGNTEANSTIVVKNASDVQIGTIKADSSGNFKVTLSVALTHKETVKVYATDDAANTSAATSIQAPLLAAIRASHLNNVNEASIDMQLNSLIQTMAAFSPSPAAESHKLIGVYDHQSIILASQS